MKKKVLAMTLVGTLCTAMLAGCGGQTSANDKAGGDAAATGDAYNVTVIVKHTDGHFNKVIAGAMAYGKEHDNVNVEIQSPTSATSYDEQVNMIETALGNPGIDAVVVAPQQSTSTATLVASANKPVLALDTDFTSDKKACFVGTGNEDAALNGGKAVAEACKSLGKDKPTAVIIAGVQGDETHEARLRGYRDAIEAAGGQVLEVQYTDTMPDKAAAAMEAVIQKYPNGVDAVLSIADDMALAAAKVIKDSGNTNYADTVLCGFDGNQSAIETVKAGSLTIDIAQMGYDMGYKAVEAAVKVLDGDKVDSFIDSGSKVIDSGNIEDYIADMKSKRLWE